jgi:hypothetical protein
MGLSPWVARMVRLGYAAKGIIYLLIGILAVRLVLGDGGRVTDASGVLRTLLQQPFGLLLLASLAVGILAYAGWQIAEGLWDTRRRGSNARGWMNRSLTIIKGVVYGAIGWEAIQIVLGIGGRSADADDYARQAMRVPFGNLFFGLIGIGVAIYGVTQIRMAWQARFDDDLDQNRLRREGAGWILPIGRAGIGARGVILVLTGLALARAGFDRSPSKAGGVADSLWTLFSQPFGSWLLAAVAAGLACFGLFQLLHARYARLK